MGLANGRSGHEERFPRRRLSGRCGFRKQSVAVETRRRRLLGQALTGSALMRESNELAQYIGMFLRVILCQGEPIITPPHVVTQRIEPSSIDFTRCDAITPASGIKLAHGASRAAWWQRWNGILANSIPGSGSS
jgi:hypothetical protein